MIGKRHITMVLLLISCRIFPQAFTCDHTFYVVMQVNGKSALHNMWLDGSNHVKTPIIPLSQPDRRYTCLGFSVDDLHLYALDFDTKELLRIDADGTVKSLGIPENLDTSLEYRGGDVMPDGRRLVVIGYDKNFGKDRIVFSINLTSSNQYAGGSGLVAYLPTQISDLATDPIRGVTYGYDKINQQIVVINTNAVTHQNHKKIDAIMESLFFDEKGNLYGYGSETSTTEQSTLYAIDKIKGGATPISGYVPGLYTDGCSCAATLSFTRTVYPSRILPCTEFTIDYNFTNHIGIGKTNIILEDVLPPFVTITEIVDHTFTLASIESGVGTNQLYIPNLDVLIGDNLVRIKAKLDPTTTSVFETQAILDNLPLGLGSSLLSDNPYTTEPLDPNLIEVVESDAVELEDYLHFDCGNDAVILSIPFPAQSYRWSDGSTDPTLLVSEPGLYWLEAVGECFTLKDSVLIQDFPGALDLDLGQDQQIPEGTILDLQFVSNAAFIQQLSWQSARDFDLSCADCPNPKLVARQDNTYYLELMDGNGCRVRDTLRVRVIPAREIYVPNAFSPNGDGINDIFFIQGNNAQAVVSEFRVFNRWGTLIFACSGGNINDAAHGWNGKIGGRPADTGLYVWVAKITYGDGQVREMNGEVMILIN